MAIFSQDIKGKTLFQENNKEGSGLGFIRTESQNPGLGIQVCVNSNEPRKFHADAITKGNSIFLSAGAEGLLRHEMGHVIQQRRGEITPTRYVAGQQLNDSVSLEREADRLGSMISRQIVGQALSSAGKGMSLQGTDGVVQCGKFEEEREIEGIAQELISKIEILGSLKSGRSTQNERKRLNEDISQMKEELILKLRAFYPQTDLRLIQELVRQIGNGNYKTMEPGLRSHLYHGLPVGVPVPTAPPPSKARPGKIMKPKGGAKPAPKTATGLHAYNDFYDKKGTFVRSGVLPEGIHPLGIFGNPNQVHILHWIGKEGKSKFSTMLPQNMREGISKLLFEVAAESPDGSTFGEFAMGKSGDTIYPLGDGIGIGILRSQVLGKKCQRPEDEMTLNEIFEEYDPDKNEAYLLEMRPHLIKIGAYKPLG